MKDERTPRPSRAPALVRLLLSSFILLPSSFLLLSCQPRNGEPGARRDAPYYGPTLTISELVAAINENNRRLPTLWTQHTFEANIVEEPGGRRTFVNGVGELLYQAPQSLLLLGRKPVAGTLFELGSNDERYWMMVPLEDVDTLWWGRYQHLGSPCAEPIPIRPDLIVEVLGVSAIDPDLTRLPAPTMRFNPDADAYMLVWNVRAPDRYVALKEVWYDRETLLPTLVLLFDDNGRVILRAYLTGHAPVEVPGEPPEGWPMVAREYDLFFPDTGSTLDLSVTQALLERDGRPNARTFAFPPRPPVSRVIQLDEACDP